MVRSRIDKKIIYSENKKIEEADKDLEATLWDWPIHNIDVVIATGNIKEKKTISDWFKKKK